MSKYITFAKAGAPPGYALSCIVLSGEGRAFSAYGIRYSKVAHNASAKAVNFVSVQACANLCKMFCAR